MSKAGRTPIAPANAVDANIDAQAISAAVMAADQMKELQASYGQERDLLNQLLGQAQMAGAFEDFSRTVRTAKLAFVKENKLYQQLKGSTSPHGAEILTGTWEEFCKLLNRSVDQVDRDIANLKAFGEEALESMSRMGIGYRELRQYRKLPEDQKQALLEVAKKGDKGDFLDLAEEMIAKHAKEKEQLTAQIQEAQDSIEAKDRVLADKNEHITRLEEQTSMKFKPRPGSEARTAEEQRLLDEIQEATAASQKDLRRLFVAADAAIEGDAREAIQLVASQSVEYLCQQLIDIATEFNISVNLEERLQPSWLTPEALTAMEARQAEREAAEK